MRREIKVFILINILIYIKKKKKKKKKKKDYIMHKYVYTSKQQL